MKVFVVKRTDPEIPWGQDYEMTVVAPNYHVAIEKARFISIDFRNIESRYIEANEINLDEEQILTVANTGD